MNYGIGSYGFLEKLHNNHIILDISKQLEYYSFPVASLNTILMTHTTYPGPLLLL